MLYHTDEDKKISQSDNPYLDRLGIIHAIDDFDGDGKLFRWTGKLISIVGRNLLFEKRNGLRILVDPTKVARIIELAPRRP